MPTDPNDEIIPDPYGDVPIAHEELAVTSFDNTASYMWGPTSQEFLQSIDFSQPPRDPETWFPTVDPNYPPVDLGNRGGLPWEAGGGSTGDGGDIGGGGTGGGGDQVAPPDDGGGGGGRMDVLGRMNTNTGVMNRFVPIVSFCGPGRAEVDLALQFRQVGPESNLWTHNYDVRLDVSRRSSTALITFPSGLRYPFARVGAPPPDGQPDTSIFAAPIGIRATLRNVNGTGYQLQWRNGDVWFFSSGYLSLMTYKGGGTVGLSRANGSTTISTGGRSVTVDMGVNVPSGYTGRIVGPHGTTLVSQANPSGAEASVTIHYPGTKRVKLFYSVPFYSGYQYLRRCTGYQDGKQVAANTSLRYTYGYDVSGRLNRVTLPTGDFAKYDYGVPTVGKTKVTDVDNNVSYDHYKNGQYIGQKDQAGFETSYVRNLDHDITQFRNERGQRWVIGRSTDGDPISVTDPRLKTSTATFNSFGSILTSTNALGKTTTFGYDNSNRLETVTNPLQQVVTTVVYKPSGDVESVADALGRLTAFDYETNGELRTITNPTGLVTIIVRANSLGAPTRVTTGTGRSTDYEYDVLYRVKKVTDPYGKTTTIQYDDNDNVLSVTDPLSQTSTFDYDTLNRLKFATNPKAETQSYTYDKRGNITEWKNARNYITKYQYTSRSEMKYLKMPDGTIERYNNYADGTQWQFFGSGRGTTTYYYDSCGRPSKTMYVPGKETLFTYDDAGRLISMASTLTGSPTRITSWFYDDADRLTSLDQEGAVTSYAYNIADERTSMISPAGSTTYEYNLIGQLWKITNPLGQLTQFTYDGFGRLQQKNLSSGTKEIYGYDNMDRLTGITTQNAANSILRQEGYIYRDNSQIQSHTVDGVTTAYGYDLAGQLNSESRSGYNATYAYDANGNRTQKTLNGSSMTFTYDAGDKLLSAGSKTYQFDLAGRTTQVNVSGAITTLAYDEEDRVTSIVGPSGTFSHAYNGLGTRTHLTTGGATRFFHRDGAYVTDPLLSDGLASYTPGISENRSGVTTFSHSGIKNAGGQSSVAQSLTSSRT